MELNYNFVSLIDTLALIQGLLFGLWLIYGSRNNKPLLYLGLFLITYTIEISLSLSSDLGITRQFSSIELLPFRFYYLSVPLLYLYTKQVIGNFNIKKDYWILIPGITEFIVFSFLFVATLAGLFSIETFSDSVLKLVYEVFSLIFSVFWACLCLWEVSKHQKRIVHFYSNIDKIQLKWITNAALVVIIFYTVWIISIFSPEELMVTYMYPILSAVNVVFIYWVAFSGFQQKVISKSEVLLAEPKNNKKKSNKPKQFDDLCMRLKTEKMYKDQELTLLSLAEKLDISRNELSQLINENSKENFNSFINSYRVEEAKKLLANPDYDHYNMLGVAYESGFNSKATFFVVFKNQTGTTPGNFKKSAQPE